MGALLERIKLEQLVYGGNIVDFYKLNSQFMYDNYQKSDDSCKSISKEDLRVGGFYFLHYMDDSNWMKWSPIFCCDVKMMSNLTVLLGVNFNFIPLEIRGNLFDKFITEKNFENNDIIEVNFKGMYSELLRYGYEYAIQEYNTSQIRVAHRISLELLPRFLYSSYPKNKYDPNKLVEIWEAKLDSKEKRHQEIISSNIKDFYTMKEDILSKYQELGDHIKRVQKSYQKYGLS